MNSPGPSKFTHMFSSSPVPERPSVTDVKKLSDGTPLRQSDAKFKTLKDSVQKTKRPKITLGLLAFYDIAALKMAVDDEEKKDLLKNLALYFSIERDREYYEALEAEIKPKLLGFAREDRYTELCVQIIFDALHFFKNNSDAQTLSAGTARELINSNLEKILNAYEDTVKARLRKGEKINDPEPQALIMDMKLYLEFQIEENNLAKLLTDRSASDLERHLPQREEAHVAAQNQSIAVQEQFLHYGLHVAEATKAASQHSLVTEQQISLSSAHDIATQSINVTLENQENNTLLDEAIQTSNLPLISQILTYAKYSNSLVKLLHQTLKKLILNNNRNGQLFLIAGTYLFDFDKKGLFNPEFAKEICKHSSFDADFTSMFDKNDRLILTKDERKQVSDELLKQADDINFAHFIDKAGTEQWPHNYSDRAAQIRDELRRRYITNAEPMQNNVSAVLNKNLALVDDAETLGAFFGRATRRVCIEYQTNSISYANKIDLMLTKVEESAKSLTTGPEALKNAAIDIATEWTDPNSKLGETRPGTLAHKLHLQSTTQQLVATAKAMITASGVTGFFRRKLIQCTTPFTKVGRQDDSSILIPSTPSVETAFNEELLKRIPITSNEKEACMKRAALAQGVFKKTLNYLKTRTYDENKKVIMDEFIQHYVDGHDKENKPYTAENLMDDLDKAKENPQGLGKHVGWLEKHVGLTLWTPTTVKKLNKDLTNKDTFMALHQKLGLNTASAAG